MNLVNSNKNIVVPIKWIQSIDLGKICNDGLNHSIIYKIFFSSNKYENPDFNSEAIKSDFEAQRGIYEARLLWHSGKTRKHN